MSGVSHSRGLGAPARAESHAVPRLTPAERAARGKAERAEVPRSLHAEWEPPKNRRDPVDLLEEQAESRVPELVPIRYGRMMSTGFYDDSVRQLNNALDARRDRLETASGGLPRDIAVLIIFSSFVIVAYAVLVGSPSFWSHVLGPVAIAVVVAVSLVVLVDLTYPFSGDVALTPDDFKEGALARFFPG